MSDLKNFTADDLLGIPENKPFKLFSGNRKEASMQFRTLVGQWHPDRNSGARADLVTAHINALYNKMKKMRDSGQWVADQVLHLECLDGRYFRLGFRQSAPFELGDSWLARSHLGFAIKPAHRDLLDRALAVHDRLEMADEAMARQMKGLLPTGEILLETVSGPVLVMKKAPELVRLDGLIAAKGGGLDPRHGAWILSGLYQLACYLEVVGLVHNGLAPDTVFIDPAGHRVALPGAWWYAAPTDAPLKALPRWTLEHGPAGLARRPRAGIHTDLELVKALGRTMLGSGAIAPEPLRLWLALPAGDTALNEFQQWQHVLDNAFGPRRFVSLAADFDHIHPNRGEI